MRQSTRFYSDAKKLISKVLATIMIIATFISGDGVINSCAMEPEIDLFKECDFKSLYDNNKLVSNNEEVVTYDNLSNYEGLIIKTEKNQLPDLVFAIDEEILFKDNINWINVNMTAKRGSKTTVKFYLDDVSNCIGSYRIGTQKKEKLWGDGEYVTIPVNGQFKGTHRILFSFEDEKAVKKPEFLLRSIKLNKETIPLVNLEIDESIVPISKMNNDDWHEQDCFGDMSIIVSDKYKEEYNYEGGTYELDYIRGRGNSTWFAKKKPYKIKLDKKADLFGMGTNKHWVLLANAFDDSLVRNRMTYWLGQKLGLEFTPECINVDVVMNGKYLGNYLLCEQVRIDESRVDINNLEDTYSEEEGADYSGGYLLGMSPYGDEHTYCFKTDHGVTYSVESPESEYELDSWNRLEDENFVDEAQYKKANEYIKNYMNDLEEAIYSDDFTNSKGESYDELLDVDSAIKYFWMQEFSANGDAYATTSTYLYKKPDVKDESGNVIEKGKLYFGPLWDFDYVAWNSYVYSDVTKDDGYVGGWYIASDYFSRLLQNPEFYQKFVDYYFDEFKPAIIEVIKSNGLLDKYGEELLYSADNNFEVTGYNAQASEDFIYEWLVIENERGIFDFGTYPYEIERLRESIIHRMKWIDGNFDSLKSKNYVLEFYDGENLIDSMDCSRNSFYLSVPDMPKKRDNKYFGGWFVTTSYYDEEGNLCCDEYQITTGTPIECINLENEPVCKAYAKWLSEKDIIPIQGVHFGQKKYNGYIRYDSEGDIAEASDFVIDYQIYPYDATCNTLLFKSSNEDVALVDENGYVFIHEPGDTTLYANDINGNKFSVDLHVDDLTNLTDDELFERREIYSIDLEENYFDMNIGEYREINRIINPENAINVYANNDLVIYSSTNDEVASVSNGVIHANQGGEAIITVVSTDSGWVGVVKVYVNEDIPDVDPDEEEEPYVLKKGDTFTKNNIGYTVICNNKKFKTVSVNGIVKNKAEVVIPANVKYDGIKFDVIRINSKAFAKNTKIKKLEIGKNISKIGEKAFYKCSKLSTIKINSSKLTGKSIGEKAFSKINKKVSISVPKKQLKEYKKLLTKAGVGKKAKIQATAKKDAVKKNTKKNTVKKDIAKKVVKKPAKK